MPAYNAEATIDSAIRSALAQSLEDFELIVADDESIDGTIEIVRRHRSDPRVRLVRCRHGGLAATRNAALSVARGRYFSLLDSDDLWMPNYLEVMGASLAENPDAAFAYTDAWMFDNASRLFSRSTAMAGANPPDPPPTDPFEFFVEMLQRNFVYVGVTMRRAVIDAIGTFNAALRASEDYDLWLRTLAHGYGAVRAPGLLGLYRLRRDSLSSDPLFMREAILRVYAGLAEDPSLPPLARAAAGARLEEATAERDALVRSLSTRSPYLGLRSYASRIKRALLTRRDWLRSPPVEVSSVFPDIRTL